MPFVSAGARARLRALESPDGDPGVVEDQAVLVEDEDGREVERRRGVVVAPAAALVLQAEVALLDALDVEVGGADVGGRRFGPLADLEREPADREQVRAGGGLEVDVEGAVELG